MQTKSFPSGLFLHPIFISSDLHGWPSPFGFVLNFPFSLSENKWDKINQIQSKGIYGGVVGGVTNDTCQRHKATAGSHNALSFSRAKFIEQFKEHLKQRN